MKTDTFDNQTETQSFQTHLIYIQKLALLSRNLNLEVNTPIVDNVLTQEQIRKVEAKLKLIEMTKFSVDQELAIVRIDPSYSSSSILWLPIKIYYLNYHLLCLIDFFLTSKETSLSIGHKECLGEFSRRLQKNDITFSEPIFNQTFDKSILDFIVQPGSNLTMRSDNNEIFKLLMKKTAKESLEESARIKKITNKRLKSSRESMEKEKSRLLISIFSFFYFMRIRLNYRNFTFIENIPAGSTAAYFEVYYDTANNFYTCLMDTLNRLKKGVLE